MDTQIAQIEALEARVQELERQGRLASRRQRRRVWSAVAWVLLIAGPALFAARLTGGTGPGVSLAPIAFGAQDVDPGAGFRQAQAGAVLRSVGDKLSESLSVKDFGARGDGASDDSAAIQAALNALAPAGGALLFPPGAYLVSTGLRLPTAAAAHHVEYRLEGPGATLRTTAPITILSQAMPPDMDAAVTQTNRRFRINGLRFEGSGRASQVGLQLVATYGSVVEDCAFVNLDTGLDLVFCLMAQVRGCFGVMNRTCAFRARSGRGLWAGATGPNSASNHSSFQSCRDYASDGQAAQFHVEESSGVVLEDCITEGLSSIDSVRFDANGAPTARTFFIRNLHSENAPRGSILRLLSTGTVVVDGLFFQLPATAIDTSGSNDAGCLVLRNVPWWPAGSRLKQSPRGAFRWLAENGIGAYGQLRIEDPAHWVAGSVPIYRLVQRSGGPTDRHLAAPYPVIEAPNVGVGGNLVFSDAGHDLLNVRNVTLTRALSIGAGATPIARHLSGTQTWDPPGIADGAVTSTTLRVAGAAVGDTVSVGFSRPVPAGALLAGAVTAPGAVSVTLFNKTGAVLDLASGALRADGWQH